MFESRGSFWLAAALALVLLAGAGAVWSARRRSRPRDAAADDRLDTIGGWPPTVTRLLTHAERAAFALLQDALPDHLVFCQVPLARFIDVPKRNSYADWLRRVGHQSIDFLICDLGAQVIAVVDLQPPASPPASPRMAKRQARIARTLKAAKVPLHVWTANSLPSAELARDSILGMVREPLSSAPMPLGEPELPFDAAAATSARGRPGRSGALPSAAAAAAAKGRNPFEESGRDSSLDEFIEAQEPPPTTWYDEFDSGPTPLSPDQTRRPRR